MARDSSLPALLAQLTAALESAASAVPDAETALPPHNGISLLDVKTELFLSYVQNLAFLILLKLHDHAADESAAAKESNGDDPSSHAPNALEDQVVKKLVELRVYLERGVKPLEGRLKYQIDKVTKAAADAAPGASTLTNKSLRHGASNGAQRKKPTNGQDDDDSGSEAASQDAAESGSDELSYRPNPASIARVAGASTSKWLSRQPSDGAKADGVYRPPRINPTAMPQMRAGMHDGRAVAREKPARSRTLDEFVNTEMSTAPAAEPSIGSTIVSGGRRSKSAREMADEAERTAYEEENFLRLPLESKKERSKKRNGQAGGMFGGEDLRGLGEGLDRIGRLTGKRKGGAARLTEDGPRASGHEGFGRFHKRRR